METRGRWSRRAQDRLQDCQSCSASVIRLYSRNVLDLVFPSNSYLEKSLGELSGKYQKGQIELGTLLEMAYSLTDKYSSQSDMVALSLGSIDTDDVWCLDHQGVLTLSLSKETYYQLGLVSEKKSKKYIDRFVVQIDMYDQNSKLFTRAKESFRMWDERRSSRGIGPWDVLFQGFPDFSQAQTELVMKPFCTSHADVYIPQMDLKAPQLPSGTKEGRGEAVEDWHEKLSELFEWVGMVCLDSERLKANDRVNPYVALYEPPLPNKIGDVSRLRWRGFLTPAFVQTILKTAVNSLDSDKGNSPPEFIALTANTFPNAPLSYISPSAFAEGAKGEVRRKCPAKNVQCWSLITKPTVGGKSECDWVLATVESPL